MKESIVNKNHLNILYKYGWVDCNFDRENGCMSDGFNSIDCKFKKKCYTGLPLEYNLSNTIFRIVSVFMYCLGKQNIESHNIHLLLYNKNGLYFIHGNNIYLHNKDFTKNRENDFNNMKIITELGDKLENDIKKYNLMSDDLIRNERINSIVV